MLVPNFFMSTGPLAKMFLLTVTQTPDKNAAGGEQIAEKAEGRPLSGGPPEKKTQTGARGNGFGLGRSCGRMRKE